MADGQKLRWWQDEEGQNQAAQKAIERVAVAPKPLLPEAPLTIADEETDTWAEIEAEATRRAAQVKTEAAESVSFYTDKAAVFAHGRQHRRFTTLVSIIQAALTLMLVWGELLNWQHYQHMASHFHFQIPAYMWRGHIISLITVILCPLLVSPLHLYIGRRFKRLQESTEPTVRLCPQGIHLCTLNYKNVLLPWNEITVVKRKSAGQYFRLELRNTKGRRFNIPVLHLGTSVEALAEQIEDYKMARGIA